MTYPSFPSQNRPDRAVISLAGDNVLGFLDNLLTCDCASLAEGAAVYGALLTPQGKILHDVFVYNAGHHILLDCATSQRSSLLQRLAVYKLRAKIQITLDNELEVGVHMERSPEGKCYVDPRVAAMGFRSFNSPGSLINAPSSTAYDERRITLGLGDSNADIGSELMFPHEANFDQMDAVSFTKGCYVGQEVVSRVQHRGTARSRLLPLFAEGHLMSGEGVMSGEMQVGTVHSTSHRNGLALLRIDKLVDAKAPLTVNGVGVRVQRPDWISYEVTT
jgi:tRNA-modifying protein YgfZ